MWYDYLGPVSVSTVVALNILPALALQQTMDVSHLTGMLEIVTNYSHEPYPHCLELGMVQFSVEVGFR